MHRRDFLRLAAVAGAPLLWPSAAAARMLSFITPDKRAGGSVIPPCTLDPVNKGAGWALSGGNLVGVNTANGHNVYGTTSHSTGKRYFEMRRDTTDSDGSWSLLIGVGPAGLDLTTYLNTLAAWTYYSWTGTKYYNNAEAAYGANWRAAGDIVGVAVDIDAGKIWWSKAGTWQASGDPASGVNPAYTGLSGALFPIVGRIGGSASTQVTMRFKSADFTYSPPSGFTAWGG
jgi:hypothetical protein